MAVDAMRSLLTLEESLAEAAPAAAPALAAPPAPAPLRGWAFVELAVEPASAADTQRLLHAMGFAHAAQPMKAQRSQLRSKRRRRAEEGI